MHHLQKINALQARLIWKKPLHAAQLTHPSVFLQAPFHLELFNSGQIDLTLKLEYQLEDIGELRKSKVRLLAGERKLIAIYPDLSDFVKFPIDSFQKILIRIFSESGQQNLEELFFLKAKESFFFLID